MAKKSKQKSRRYKRYIRKQIKNIYNKKTKFSLKLIPNINFPQNIHNIKILTKPNF